MGSSLDRLAQEVAASQGVTTQNPDSSLDQLTDKLVAAAEASRRSRFRLPDLPPDFSDVQGNSSTTAPTTRLGALLREAPGAIGRAALDVGRGIEGIGRNALTALGPPVQGTTSPYSALYAKAGPVNGLLAPGQTVTAQNSPTSITPQQFKRSATATAINAGSALAGPVLGRATEAVAPFLSPYLGNVATRIGLNAATGAGFNAALSPAGERGKAAVTGAVLGGALPEVMGLGSKLRAAASSGSSAPGVTAGASGPLALPSGEPTQIMRPDGPFNRYEPSQPAAIPGTPARPLLGPGPTTAFPQIAPPAGPFPQFFPRAGFTLPSTSGPEGFGNPPAPVPGALPDLTPGGKRFRPIARGGRIPQVLGDTLISRGAQAAAGRFSPDAERRAISTLSDIIGPNGTQPIDAYDHIPVSEADLEAARNVGNFLKDESGSLNPAAVGKTAQAANTAWRDAAVEAYPELKGLDDARLKAALLERGAASSFAGHLANYGMDYVEHGIKPDKLATIEKSVYADNMEAQARTLSAKGNTAAANRLTKLAGSLRKQVPANITADPDYQAWVSRYKQTIEPQWERVAKGSGLPDERFRQLPENSAYVPLPGSVEAGAASRPPQYRPPTAARRMTMQSGAVKEATGGGTDVLSVRNAVTSHMPERQRVAANNETYAAVKERGRPLANAKSPLGEGETLVAFDDKNKIVAPDAETARQYVAVPDRVANALRVSEARLAPKGPVTPISKVGSALKRGVTAAETTLSPAIVPVHGRNIISTVGAQSGGVASDIAASALPLGKDVSGITRLANVDFTDPETVQNMIGMARYGGLREAENAPGVLRAGGRALFGTTGIDPRGRAALAKLYLDSHPGASAAEVAQHVTNELGNYVTANQPAGIRFTQRTGLTSFAPAAASFTRGAIRRLGFMGEGTVGQRLGRFGRTVVSPLATLEGLNYLTTGHSTLSNGQGHRLDFQTTGSGPIGGSAGPEGGNKYVGLSTVDPLLSRALNQTGLRGAVEGEGVPGALRRSANATMAHLGILPRAALGLANAEPYLTQAGQLATASPPQFNQNKQILKAGGRAVGAVLGAPATALGATSFSENETLPQRAGDIFGIRLPYEDYRTAPGAKAEPSDFNDKEATAVRQMYDAKPQERGQVYQNALRDARAAGYDGYRIRELAQRLRSAARKAGATRH